MCYIPFCSLPEPLSEQLNLMTTATTHRPQQRQCQFLFCLASLLSLHCSSCFTRLSQHMILLQPITHTVRVFNQLRAKSCCANRTPIKG
ncbi:hypothetical protein JCM19237_4106 [Photobacterium aphoticum]|uniref:Uncharacterized protein n=1 Tax=Photobacterium aphoticum TaxID=754436 RepID=A0A090QNJ3_9GAMM|nr:hypothetical protein JCM19237_4106 [Photobacterium aphoticum]